MNTGIGGSVVAPWRLVAVMVAAACAAASFPARAQSLPDIDRVTDHLDSLYRSTSAHALMTMTVVRPRQTRELELESWSKGEDRALVVIRAPAREAGTATLRTEEGLWSYGARADRLIRIPSGLLSESWMGSHLTNDDLMRESSYDEDYESSLAWEVRDGTRYLQVTLTPEPEAPVVYTKLVFLLTSDEWIPVRWEYYDDEEIVRTIEYSDIQQVAGRPLPLRMVIQPANAPNERTLIVYQKLELGIPVSNELFTRRGLRRVVSQ